jgi:beta-phosphoglucomutase-like phosphatase (HAD superfamily)
MPARAIVFDFNGTLSDDEPILCDIYVQICTALGSPLSAQEYFDRLAGLSDEEIFTGWLGERPDLDDLVRERVDRYRATVSDGRTVYGHVREAVRYAAEHAALAICSGSARREIEPVVAAAGLSPCFHAIVSSDDVVDGKPDPEGYAKAFALLGVAPEDAVVVEDTEAGIASARAAGAGRVLALKTTLEPYRLVAADELVDRIDVDVIRRCLS